MDYKPVFQALADRFAADMGSSVLPGGVTRKNLPASAFKEQPALCVVEDSLGYRGGIEVPLSREVGAIVVLHARVLGDAAAPGNAHLDLISRVEDALKWHAGERTSNTAAQWTTLGDRVRYARLAEEVAIDDDVHDASQVTITLRVRMLVID